MADKPPQNPDHDQSSDHQADDFWKIKGSSVSDGSRPPRQSRWLRAVYWLAGAVCLAFWVWLIAVAPSVSTPRVTIPYSVFRTQVRERNIASVTATGETIQGQLRKKITYPPGTHGRDVHTVQDRTARVRQRRAVRATAGRGRHVGANPTGRSTPFWQSALGFVVPFLLIGGVFFLMMRGGRGAGGLSMFGKSKARRYEPTEQQTTFADIAGIDEATDELAEVVDFLRNPDRYRALGAIIPRGVLLTGPPGTGKTLLAKAVAGEAEVPFFSLSASEFIEMYVGVGASRVRDLFQRAKSEAPAIIFIDELDAIGRTRSGSSMSSGGHDEREQTLNQVLTEMDGFTGSEGVIVLAATNRPEILDAALLRPGRFDRRVAVNPPDQKGREQILAVHTRSVPLDPEVELETVASSTPGMVGADLRNLVNEAALLAAHRGLDAVGRDEFADALEKIVLGAARHILISPEERERTAYHESGHALIGMLEPGADPVRKISIIPRGRALGVTFQSPEKDRYGFDEDYLRGRMTGLLGGRAAEELIYGAVTSGAESDLEQATALGRHMVGRWGMSDKVGLVTVLPPDGVEPLLMDGGASERTRQLVDMEVRKLADQCHRQALSTLGEHREQLESLAQALLERETLDEVDAYAAAGIPHQPAHRTRSTGH